VVFKYSLQDSGIQVFRWPSRGLNALSNSEQVRQRVSNPVHPPEAVPTIPHHFSHVPGFVGPLAWFLSFCFSFWDTNNEVLKTKVDNKELTEVCVVRLGVYGELASILFFLN
jgi:hypothetical protein